MWIQEKKKKKTTSDVWEHFTRKKNLKLNAIIFKAQCYHCSKFYLGDSSQGITHLRNYLVRCPWLNLNAYQFNQAKVRNNLARMVILHEYPLSMVDQIGFREFVDSLQPLFKLVSRNTLKSDILKIYDNEREKVLKMIDKNGSRMVITTNMWTSSNKKRGFVYVPSPHTKDVIAEVFVDCFLKRNISRELYIITTNNCSTNDIMIRLLLNKLDTSSLMLGGSMLHMRYGLSLIGDGIEMIRHSVIYWTGSPKRRQKFDENACQLHVQCTKELVLDCKTRWNSTYLMLSTTLIYKDLNITLNEWSLSSNEMISRMTESMLVKFNSYRANVNVVMAVAARAIHRYKMKLLEFYYPNIYGDNSDLKIEKIKNLCYDLLDEYGEVDESPVDNEGSSHMPASTSNYVAQMKCSTSGRLLSLHRSRLHPKTIKAMMCAQNWLWSEING
ncbi:hypothetical protein ACB092_09G144200 [Castanea dentata]